MPRRRRDLHHIRVARAQALADHGFEVFIDTRFNRRQPIVAAAEEDASRRKSRVDLAEQIENFLRFHLRFAIELQ